MKAGERGNGTVLSLAFMFVIAATGFLVLVQVQAVMRSHAVQGAADLAAIAAAQASGDGCRKAQVVAEANRVRLVDCTTQDDDFIVRVESDLPSLVSALLTFARVDASPIRAAARASVERG